MAAPRKEIHRNRKAPVLFTDAEYAKVHQHAVTLGVPVGTFLRDNAMAKIHMTAIENGSAEYEGMEGLCLRLATMHHGLSTLQQQFQETLLKIGELMEDRSPDRVEG